LSRKSCSTLLATLVTSCLGAPISQAQSWFQPWLGIDADVSLGHCTQQAGGRCALVCPASDGRKANVEGTDVYSNYSSICAAAVHAGVLEPGKSGSVVIVIGPGERSYRGSERNGVTSRNYGPRASSFRFAKDGAPGLINWQTSWSRMPADFSGPITVTCPPGGDTNTRIWGTDVYTVDSSICGAAVHAGVITMKGGEVTVQRSTGLAQYPASQRGGVASRSAGANADAFRVMAVQQALVSAPEQVADRPLAGQRVLAGNSQPVLPVAADATPGEMIGELQQRDLGEVVTPLAYEIPPRLLTLTGFTAAGTAIPVPPKTIQLPGFTAAGTAIPIPPRIIVLPGWTASGPGVQGVIQ
jgi:hypothetical protein